MQKELKVSAIREGTVIDHIPSRNAFKVARILDLSRHDNVVSVVMNLPSKMMGKKAIIKVGGKYLSEEEFNKITVIAPKATVNIIKNYEVKEKRNVSLPKVISKVIKCSNPQCITNKEEVRTKFFVVSKEPLRVKCNYCERSMLSDEIEVR